MVCSLHFRSLDTFNYTADAVLVYYEGLSFIRNNQSDNWIIVLDLELNAVLQIKDRQSDTLTYSDGSDSTINFDFCSISHGAFDYVIHRKQSYSYILFDQGHWNFGRLTRVRCGVGSAQQKVYDGCG